MLLHEHCGSLEASGAQVSECLVGLLEPINCRRHLDPDLWCDAQEIEPILSG